MKNFSPKRPFLQPFPRQNCIRTNIVIKKPKFCIIISKTRANIPKNRAFFTTKSDEKCQKIQQNPVEIQRKNRQKTVAKMGKIAPISDQKSRQNNPIIAPKKHSFVAKNEQVTPLYSEPTQHPERGDRANSIKNRIENPWAFRFIFLHL